jgi:hypothetical protein
MPVMGLLNAVHEAGPGANEKCRAPSKERKKLGLSFTDHDPEQTSEFLANGLPVAKWLECPLTDCLPSDIL